MAQRAVLVAGLLLIAESQASDEADRSTHQGFLSNYDNFITPNFNRVKQGNGPDALSFAPNGASTKPVRGGRPKDFGFLKDLGLEKPSWLPDFGGADEKPKEEKPAAKKWFFDNSNPLGLSALSVALLSLAGLLGVRMRRGVQSAADLAMPMAQASVDNILELKA